MRRVRGRRQDGALLEHTTRRRELGPRSGRVAKCVPHVVWAGFSVAATLAQWGLHEVALLSPMMVGTSSTLGGLLLLAAGLFQWTPLKHACLTHCRSPVAFLMTEWREFVSADWGRLCGLTKEPRLLFDGRNALDPTSMVNHGFEYMGIGRGVRGAAASQLQTNSVA